MTTRTLDDLAKVRAGNKGDTLVLAAFLRDARAFAVIERELTGEPHEDQIRDGSTHATQRGHIRLARARLAETLIAPPVPYSGSC